MKDDPFFTYKQIVRASDGYCPDDMDICPGSQSPENQLCVEHTLSDCPINQITIVKNGDEIPSNVETIPFVDDLSLVFSRDQDKRPLTSFKIAF